MQIGEVSGRSRRSVQRFDVRNELNQVSGNEARGQSEMPQKLHQQPRRVAARAGALRQCFLGRLHSRLHADEVTHIARQAGVDSDQQVHDARRFTRNGCKAVGQQRRRRQLHPIRRELLLVGCVVFEWKPFRIRLQKEIEWIEDRHFGDQVDFDPQVLRLVGKHEPREIVGLRILLPVDEVLLRVRPQRIGQDARAGMRGGTQPHDLGTQSYAAVVAVMGYVVECDVD